jgi:hypothetical protein
MVRTFIEDVAEIASLFAFIVMIAMVAQALGGA